MNIAEEQAIRNRTAALLLEWAAGRQPPFTGETDESFADAIVAAHAVADEARIGLQRWIDAARRAGLSWTEIGAALGISKQAAQQRFRTAEPADETLGDGEEVVRLGATAFNEIGMLRAEGQKGRELIRTGMLSLVFRPTAVKWEYSRRVGGAGLIAHMEEQGWILASTWLPFHYFKRPISAE